MQALVIHGKQDLREENIDLPALAPEKCAYVCFRWNMWLGSSLLS